MLPTKPNFFLTKFAAPMTKQKEWFENWFDTHYYHILYKKRDDQEAALFLDNLINHLQPKPDATFLDLACGKGRHSVYLNAKGFDVTGVDLSANSIAIASKAASEHLRFMVHDIRQPLGAESFNYIVNLFTSFGYFENEAENSLVLLNAFHALKAGGVMVLDYFNGEKPNLQFDILFEKIIDGVRFEIIKHVENGVIVKRIKVMDGNQTYNFEERVRIYYLPQLKQLMEEAGFTIRNVFGSYQLEPFQAQTSDRLILIAEK